MSDGSRSVHPNALPNYQRALLPQEKMEGYALNSTHVAMRPGGSSGKDEARVFKGVLGFDQSNCDALRQRIVDELPFHEAILETERSQYGRAHRVDLPILGMNGNTANVRTSWLIRAGTDYPSLITL
jgi:uncharacterized protein